MTPIWAVGLMTGTVLDGNIDVAMIRTDGEQVAAFGPYALTPYPRAVVGMLEEAQKQALAWNFDGPEPAIFREAEDALTRAQATCRPSASTARPSCTGHRGRGGAAPRGSWATAS